MRTTLTIKQSRVFFIRVEVGRINHPSQHFLAIGGVEVVFFNLAEIDFFVNFTVDVAELFPLFGFQMVGINLIGLVHARANNDYQITFESNY